MEKSNISVLVVDDNKMNLDLLSRRLANEEYIVQGAAGGEEALKLLEIEKFDIILLDIMMPDIDGYEVLKWIKNNPAHAETPVLMLTALTERDSVVKSIKLGATDYLVKPFDMAMVKIRIWKCLNDVEIRKRYDVDVDFGNSAVLVVDDDDMNRDILSRRMQGFGCQVDVAENGTQALDMLNDKSYQLVLLDINMPGINGLEVLRLIRTNPATEEAAVIMVSANDDEEMASECIRLGAIDYISKPYNSVVLRARIKPVMRAVLLNEIDKEKEERINQLIADGSKLREE